MEFLMGRALGNNIINLGEQKEIREALEELGFDLNAIEDQEPDPLLATAVLAVWQPAFWILLLRLDTRPMAAVSATTTACSSRKLKTVIRSKCRMNG